MSDINSDIGYTVIYDTIKENIRMTKVKLADMIMTVTANMTHDSTMIQFEQADFLSPEIQFINDKFIMTYNHIVIFPEQQKDFMDAYQKTMDFCKHAGPVVAVIAEKIRKGEKI